MAESCQIDLHNFVSRDPEMLGDFRRRFQFEPMPLAVIHRERIEFKSFGARNGAGGCRIETSRKQQNSWTRHSVGQESGGRNWESAKLAFGNGMENAVDTIIPR